MSEQEPTAGAPAAAPPNPAAASYLRRFRDIPDHLSPLEDGSGRKRLSTALFVNKELSVDDGDIGTFAAAIARNPGGGLVAVPKALIASLQLEARPDPLPDNPAHLYIRGVSANSTGKRKAAQLRDAARVVHQIDGVVVVDGNVA